MKQIYMLRNEAIRNNAIDAILSLPIDDKSPHEVHIKEPKRSNPQNRLMWALLQDVSRQVEWHGRWLDAESWKCVFTAALKQQDVVPNLAGNGFVVIGQSTSRMRVGEFAELLELIQAFGTERGVKWSDEARLALEWKARWGDRAA
ncbi:recombination protein NinB [Escherichia coli]|uniref:recombination protein NinB n=1 Tax=Escherichia coli TaxID=562 RepID=UPI0019DD7F24|nr:recombination protein NinB [Escherichia coli]EFO2353293.1 recombination protein NinB [Escherichia coli]EGO9684539.1 recombination protein NinB [Escherichia coli]EHO0098021.1 recombination protein NinB [Escherichia coli]EHT6514403.1 recombination protein NinB [Escherichia coli]EHT7875786.1 recombination protein NinB [Escherichia coli]